MTGKSFFVRYISYDDELNIIIDVDLMYILCVIVSYVVCEYVCVCEFLSILEDWSSDDVCVDDDVR